MRDLIIIGGGAAGIAAALYAIDKQLDVLVIYEDVGGKAGTQQQIHGQAGDEYIAGADAVQLFERRVTMHSNNILRDRVIGLERRAGVFNIETQRHGGLASAALIIATGAAPLRLDIPGARQFLNHGIGYSITTHASLLANQHVAVIGGTRRALRGVIELARTAAQIYLIAPAGAVLPPRLAQRIGQLPNVQLLAGYAVKEIVGNESVERILVERAGEEAWLHVEAVFADIGLLPNSTLVRTLVRLDPEGFIIVDRKNASSLPGLFAAGDVTDNVGENILIAIGEGARAAASAYEYILSHPRSELAEAAD